MIRLPDPPDFSQSDHGSVGKTATEDDKSPLLPDGMVTRLSNIGFPVFKGTMLRDWIYQCEQFFSLDGTPPELKVRLAAVHMKGKALQWHHNFMSNRFGMFPTWPEYIVAVSARFGEHYDDPLSELVSLKQAVNSVEEYLEKFENTMTRMTLPEVHALSIFLKNMNPHLAFHVRQFDVTSVAAAARIANLHESSLLHMPMKHQRAPFSPYQKPNSSSLQKTSYTPTLSFIDNAKSQSPKLSSPFTIPAKRYSYQEMQDRRSKGLCIFCDEPFSPGHQLKHKKSQIFVMECDDEDDTSDNDATS